MPRSSSPRRPIVVGLLLIGAAVGLLIADHASTGRGPVSVTLGALVGPLHRAISAAGHDTRALWSHYVALSEVHEDNAALRARIGELEERAASVDGLRAENQRLRALLDLADTRKDLRLRSARVVGRSVSDFFRVLKLTLEVDAQGEDAGDTRGGAELVVGMPVIAPGGVVGQLRSVDGDRAEVLMLTDLRSAIDVVLETSRARGVAVGTGEPDRYAARLEYLQRNEATAIDERVVTSGDDGRYPAGLVVGRVTSVKPQPHGLFQDAEVEPFVDLSALEEVYIVLGPSGLTADGSELQREKAPPSAPTGGPR